MSLHLLHHVLWRLVSSILLDIIARRIFPSNGPSGLRATHHLDIFNALHVHRPGSRDKRLVTINILPEDVLLIVFLFDRSWHQRWHLNWNWHRLVHVCQRWRSVGLAYPNFLDLRLVCGLTTRVELTGIWPPVPIILKDMAAWNIPEDYDFEAAIVHHSRVCELNLLSLSNFQLHRLVAAMQDKSSSLIHLVLGSRDSNPALALPDWFLGGSAPRLQSLEIESISFRALPKLLLSSMDLVLITPWNTPDSGHISPEAIVTSLAVLAKLKYLTMRRDDKDLALRF